VGWSQEAGGRNSWDQSSMSASRTLFFRAEYVLIMRDCGGRRADPSGTRCELVIGTLERPPVKGMVL